MQESSYNVTTREDDKDMHPSGIAYIVIPPDVDRDVYIRECYATNTVSIYSEHNGYSNRVPIDKYSLNFIVFPVKVKEFGSPLSFKVEPIHKAPIIDGIYFGTDELSGLSENKFRFGRKLNNNIVEIVGSPEGKYVGINVIADTDGEIFLNVRSKDRSGKLTVNTDGDVNIRSSNNITLTQCNTYKCITASTDNEDEYAVHEQTSTKETFHNKQQNTYTDNFNINDGEEPFVLGKQWASFMKEFIEEVGNSTTTTMLGEMPLLNSIQIINFKEKVDKLLSTVGFIDK